MIFLLLLCFTNDFQNRNEFNLLDTKKSLRGRNRSTEVLIILKLKTVFPCVENLRKKTFHFEEIISSKKTD